MALHENVMCTDFIYLVDVTSTCSEYNALVKAEEARNCYFFREIPVLKTEPKVEQPEPIKAKAPKKAVKKKTRKRRVPVPA